MIKGAKFVTNFLGVATITRVPSYRVGTLISSVFLRNRAYILLRRATSVNAIIMRLLESSYGTRVTYGIVKSVRRGILSRLKRG